MTKQQRRGNQTEYLVNDLTVVFDSVEDTGDRWKNWTVRKRLSEEVVMVLHVSGCPIGSLQLVCKIANGSLPKTRYEPILRPEKQGHKI